MNKRLFKKAFKDLYGNKRKVIVAISAIMIGMIAFGTLLFSYEMITNELVARYSSTNPPSASISVDRIDKKFIELTNDFSDIENFEVKTHYKMRGKKQSGEWSTVELFASKNYSSLNMNKVFHIEGKSNPGLNEMLIERDAMLVSGKNIGDILKVKLPNGREIKLKITGVINDLGVHPATMHNTIYSYVSMETLKSIDLPPNRIDLRIKGDSYDRKNIMTTSNEYIRMLENKGYQVKKLEVEDTPGISMHLEEYKTALFMLRTFAFIAFLFGCLIMSSLITAIMSRQIKQIGILKSFGTKSSSITISYLSALFIFIIVAGCFSLPLSKMLANILSALLLRLSNMTLVNTQVSSLLYIIFLGACFIVPLVIAYIPIRKGTKTTVREAISDSNISNTTYTNSFFSGTKLFQRPVLLTLRNVLRRKGRFILNVVTLAISGVCLITILVSMLSIKTTLISNMNTFGYDYRFTKGNTDKVKIEKILNEIPEIELFEYWGFTSGKLLYQNENVGNSFPIIAIPESSKLITPDLVEGRWLKKSDKNSIVVGHKFLQKSDIDIGDSITMDIASTKFNFKIVGVVKDFNGANIYMNKSFYSQNISINNKQDIVQIKLNNNLKSRTQKKFMQKMEESLSNKGISILQSETKASAIKILNSHYMATFQTFLIVIFMILIVSSFGLASTTNIQTLERMKEIGIMKSIGADKKKIIKIITSESIFVSICGWGLSSLLAIPGIIIGLVYFSSSTLEAPIECNKIAVIASYTIWLLLTLFIGKRASKRSAVLAANMTIKENLSSN